MQKKFLTVVSCVVAMLMTCTVFLAGCFGSGTPEDTTPKEYTIQYTDESGPHTITVTDGMPYSLDVVPTKTGYDFMGLYDAEVGGTQYISASGSSLAPFSDKKNMVLFPQYKVKDYTVILDYQGAPVTGSRQLTVSYGSSLPELPKNLTGDHKEFAGWYTEAECGGTQVADEYGLIPLVSVLNEQNFDLSGAITLYAGFEMEKHTVTFCFEAGMDTEEVQVPYNTSISDVVPETRVNGNAVLTWSKTQDGEVFNGKITSDMVLYAVEYAPVIEFDSNGGKDVTPIVARAGDTVALPTPTKDMAKFSYWEDMSGNKYTSTTMPTKSTTLKAVWQAKLVFDSNGGSDVDDIYERAGTSITLPMPEREGFIFAGWYTADKEQYTSTSMPVNGMTLKAGWYKAKEETIVKIASTEFIYIDLIKPSTDKCENGLSTSQLSSVYVYGLYFNFASQYGVQNTTIKIEWHFKSKRIDNSSNLTKDKMHFDFYSSKAISSINLLDAKTIDIDNSSFKDYKFTSTFEISDSLYVFWYCNEKPSGYGNNSSINDLYYVIHYPDTTNLYL